MDQGRKLWKKMCCSEQELNFNDLFLGEARVLATTTAFDLEGGEELWMQWLSFQRNFCDVSIVRSESMNADGKTASPLLMRLNSELLPSGGYEDTRMAVVWLALSWFVNAVPWKLWTLLFFTSPLLFIAELFSPPTWYSAWHWMPHFRSSACRCFLHCMPRESCRDCSWIFFVALVLIGLLIPSFWLIGAKNIRNVIIVWIFNGNEPKTNRWNFMCTYLNRLLPTLRLLHQLFHQITLWIVQCNKTQISLSWFLLSALHTQSFLLTQFA